MLFLQRTKQGTRSPLEPFWTAKNCNYLSDFILEYESAMSTPNQDQNYLQICDTERGRCMVRRSGKSDQYIVICHSKCLQDVPAHRGGGGDCQTAIDIFAGYSVKDILRILWILLLDIQWMIFSGYSRDIMHNLQAEQPKERRQEAQKWRFSLWLNDKVWRT